MFLPENIDLAQSEKYILSIRLLPNGFSFCIYSSIDPAIFHYQEANFSQNLSLMENIRKMFFEVNLFAQPFRKVRVNVVTPLYTSVPDKFYESGRRADFFEFNIQKSGGHVMSSFVEENLWHIVYDLDKEVYSFLMRNLWNPSFSCHSAELIAYFSKYKAEKECKRCFVDFHDEMISIFCFLGRELLTANTYNNTDTFEALYNIANVWEKFPLNQNNDALFLSGLTGDNAITIDTLRKLIRNVEEITFRPKNTVPEEQMGSIPTDIMLQICE